MTWTMCAELYPALLLEVSLHGTGNKKALLIAAGKDIPGRKDLVQAEEDTWAIKKLLIDLFNFHNDDIVVMIKHDNIGKDLWPRRDNIRTQIQKLVRGASPGDHLFVYFSGHGEQVECNHFTESDGYDESIISCSGKRITDNVLNKYLVAELHKECKLFALWDACHSRTILDLDHYNCNEPQHKRGSGSSHCRPSRKAFAHIPQINANLYEHPQSFVLEAQRFRSPEPIFKCNGRCSPPSANQRAGRAHVVSLAACRDNEQTIHEKQPGSYIGSVARIPKVDQMTQRRTLNGNASLSPTRGASDGSKMQTRPSIYRKGGVMVNNVEDLFPRHLKSAALCMDRTQTPGSLSVGSQ
ncbi:caspase domain-containing protein [Scleroderma yunnanense]